MWYYDDQVFNDLEEAVEIATNNWELASIQFPLRIHRAKQYQVNSISAQSLANELADTLVPCSPSPWRRRDTPKYLIECAIESFASEFPDDDSFDDWEPKPDRQRLLWSIRLFCLVNLPLYRLMRWLGWMQPMLPDSWFSPRQHSLGLGLLQREIGRWERLQNGEGLLWTEDSDNWDDVSWEDFCEMFPELAGEVVA
jgi:hypothetical protein